MCVADEADGQFAKGTQWLVWKFESDATLADAVEGKLGVFPECLEAYMLGKVNESLEEDKRDALVRLEWLFLSSALSPGGHGPQVLRVCTSACHNHQPDVLHLQLAARRAFCFLMAIA